MFKTLVIPFFVLFSFVASAQTMLSGEALKQDIAKRCSEGCVVLNQQNIDILDQNINDKLVELQWAAYKEGQKQMYETMISDEKICPKNI